MSTILPSPIIQKVQNLITYTCNGSTTPPPRFISLHKGIIKLYFEAKEVEIDYKNRIVKADIPVSSTEFTKVSFECQDMGRFIKSCIRKDKKSLLFYQNVLSYYEEQEVA